jgi:hypothetical protein
MKPLTQNRGDDNVLLGLNYHTTHGAVIDEYGAMVELYWQEKTEELGEKPTPVPLCPPQIPMDRPGREAGPPLREASD